MPSFSIIIPVKNGADTLHGLLVSIEKQSYTNYEIIVVDNGSTDQTQAVCSQYKDVIYLFCSTPGRSVARNAGAACARYDYLAFIDCDVVLAEDWLEEVSRHLSSYPSVGLGTSIIPCSEKTGTVVDRYRYQWGKFKSTGTFLSMKKDFGVAPCINSAACIYERNTFLMEHGFNPNLQFDEDVELAIRFFLKGYFLSGVTTAKSEVRYVARYRVFQYFLRTYKISYFAISNNKLISDSAPFLVKEFISNREYLAGAFTIIIELVRMLGYISSKINPIRRKQRESIKKSWKISYKTKLLKFSFMYQNVFWGIDSGLQLILIDEDFYQIDYNFNKSLKLEKRISEILTKLLQNKELTDFEYQGLIRCGLFLTVS